jgi:integrase
VAQKWIEAKRSRVRSWTLRGYEDALERVVLPRFGTRWLNEITTEDIAALIRELDQQGLSRSTVQNYLKPLNGTLGHAVRHGLLVGNPYASLTADDWPRASERKTYEWSDREIAALLDAASESSYPLVFAAVNTGLRLSELLGLRWQDVAEDVVHVREQLSRAGSHEDLKTKASRRRVPLFDDASAFFEARRFAATYQGDNDPVFASVTGQPLQHRGVQRGFDNARDKARGVTGGFSHDDGKPVTFHDLRHAVRLSLCLAWRPDWNP